MIGAKNAENKPRYQDTKFGDTRDEVPVSNITELVNFYP